MGQTNKEPLTTEERLEITNAGWWFLNEEYIYVPNDDDGCMAYGIENIRRVLEGIRKNGSYNRD